MADALTVARNDFALRLLGPPTLTVDGEVVDFATRKVAALCFFLAANGARRIERKLASGLLWGNSSDDLARTSLRKALSMLQAAPATADLVGRDRASVWFAGDPTKCDLAAFNACLAAGTERAYRDALVLWRGEPLAGLEVGEPTFDEWIATFRADTVGFTHRLLSERLATMNPSTTPPGLEAALCELIVRIEPSDNDANARLIHRLADRGDPAAAVRQFRAFHSALNELEVPVPRDLAEFAKSLRSKAVKDAPFAPEEIALPGPPPDGRPRVMIMQPDGMRPTPDLFSFAHSEVHHQLSRFRSMRTYERHDAGERPAATLVSRIGLSDTIDHDYRLLLWDEPKANSIYLRCLNVRGQHTVSCARMPYELLADRASAEQTIASAINAIEQDILSDTAGRQDTPFARWLDAYRHLQQFTPRSDQAALGILETLAEDRVGTRLSLVHSSISSILMKQRRLCIGAQPQGSQDLDRAHERAAHALALDSLEPFNHVILGWLRVQAGEHDRALVSFDDALALNPSSSRTLIAAAEANAYCGNVEAARKLAAQALSYCGRYTPSYFYGYLASIAYLAGDLQECVSSLQRAPDNLQTTMLAVAVHQERGDETAAAAARVRFERELRRAEPSRPFDTASVSRWIVTSNMMRDESARRRLFGALERAGVPFNASR